MRQLTDTRRRLQSGLRCPATACLLAEPPCSISLPDPEELTNLVLDPKYKNMLRSCHQQLLDELRRTKAGMVDNLPKIREE